MAEHDERWGVAASSHSPAGVSLCPLRMTSLDLIVTCNSRFTNEPHSGNGRRWIADATRKIQNTGWAGGKSRFSRRHVVLRRVNTWTTQNDTRDAMNSVFLFIGAMLVAFPQLLGWLVALWLFWFLWSADRW